MIQTTSPATIGRQSGSECTRKEGEDATLTTGTIPANSSAKCPHKCRCGGMAGRTRRAGGPHHDRRRGARSLRRRIMRPRAPIGTRWASRLAVDETNVTVAGLWQDVYRAIDDPGQVIDVFVRKTRGADAAATFFCRALENTGMSPRLVTTDKAAASPPALVDVLPEGEHARGKMLQQAMERDQQHLTGRYAGMRGFKTGRGAHVFCRAHGFLRNLSDGLYQLGSSRGDPRAFHPLLLMRAWDEVTARLLAN